MIKIRVEIFDDFLDKIDKLFENISFSKQWQDNLVYDKILNQHKSNIKIGIRYIETIQDDGDIEYITVYCNTYNIGLTESPEYELDRIIERTILSQKEIRYFGLDNEGKSYFEYVQYNELRQNQNSIACLCMASRFEYTWMGEKRIENTFSMSHNDDFKSNIHDTKNILWINGKPCYKHDYVIKTNILGSISFVVMKSSQFASFYVPLHKATQLTKHFDNMYNEGKNSKNLGERDNALPAGFVSFPPSGSSFREVSREMKPLENHEASGDEIVINKKSKLMNNFLSEETLNKLRLKKMSKLEETFFNHLDSK